MVKINLKRGIFKVLLIFLSIVFLFIIYYRYRVQIDPPVISDTSALSLSRKTVAKDTYTCQESWLKKNRNGLWELYLEGDDFELGAKNGILTKELVEIQEEAFVKQIKEMIPSERYLNFLKYFIAWFNRDITKYVPLEYQKEIYGISFNASHKFDNISSPYHRLLNYHGAHDIGHAIQNMSLVKCTAFGVKDKRSKDGSLLVGRNMDFYVGDDFAKNKIIAFYKPKHGHKFSMITWGGMIGVVSGMNDQGLTITLNSANADIPTTAKTPVSILARQILQYASTVNEAYEIAKKSKVFVAELFFISSAKDHQFAVIEKTPDTIALYQEKSDVLVLTNHFQTKDLKYTAHNVASITESASFYRWKRVNELLARKKQHDVNSVVEILRDQRGLDDKNIGMGNEMAVNQLIAHHSIVFMPEKLKFWISTSPFQLGTYVCYDLNKVFSDSVNVFSNVSEDELNISPDIFLQSNSYKNYEEYRKETSKLEKLIKAKNVGEISEKMISQYLSLNPEFYYPYFIAGEYYRILENKNSAMKNYQIALSKEIPRKGEKDKIIKAMKLLK